MTKEFSLYRSNWSNEDAQVLAQTITEAIHEGLDGWSPKEQKVIKAFLEDVALACAEANSL